MRWLDIVLAIYLVLGALYGLRRGLIWVGFSLVGYIAGIILANHFAQPLAHTAMAWAPLKHWIGRYLPTSAARINGVGTGAWGLVAQVVDSVVFLAIIGVMELAGRSVGAMIGRGVRAIRLAAVVDTFGGVAAGVVEHAALAGLVMTLILSVPAIHQSSLARSLNKAPLAGILVRTFKDIVKLPGGQYL